MSKRHAQHSHLTMGGTHPPPCQKGPALTSDHGRNTSNNHVRKAQHSHLTMGGAHPTTMLERLNTYILAWEEHIQQPCKKGSALTSDHGRNTSSNHVRKAQHSHMTMGGTHPTTMSERLSTYILPWEEHIQRPCKKGSTLISYHGRNTSNNHVRKAHGLITSLWRES